MLHFKSSVSYKFCLLIDIPNLVRAFQESPAEGGKMSNSKQNQRQFDLADERNFKPVKWMVKAYATTTIIKKKFQTSKTANIKFRGGEKE